MKIAMGVILWVVLLVLSPLCSCTCQQQEQHEEATTIKVLPNGKVHARFDFSTFVAPESMKTGHYNLFPKSLGEIISKYKVQELDVALTHGTWRYTTWGLPSHGSAYPSGAHIYALFDEHSKDVSAQWKGLVNALSGMICASLNFIDEKVTIKPEYTFYPQGAVAAGSRLNQTLMKYAILPQENLCTENLTPFKKLLPCYGKAGLSTLLSAKHLLDCHYNSIALSVKPECTDKDCSSVHITLRQSVSVVLDYFTGGNRRREFSLKSLFGKAASTADICQIATKSLIKLYAPLHMSVEPKPAIEMHENNLLIAQYNYAKGLNIKVTDERYSQVARRKSPDFYAHRYLAGYGQEMGSIVCEIVNNNDETVPIVYTEYIPWFLRVFLHTLQITSDGKVLKPKKMHYSPGVERQRPYLLEILIDLPANATTTIRFEVEKLFLHWTEYPPDANLGFYVPSSIITAVLPDVSDDISMAKLKDNYGVVRLYTEKLLVALPTPDFSMPYNVICLACTVVAIAFGAIHNLTTRIFVRISYKRPYFVKVFYKIKKSLGLKVPDDPEDKVQQSNSVDPNADDTNTDEIGAGKDQTDNPGDTGDKPSD